MDSTKQPPRIEDLLMLISDQLEAIMFAAWAGCRDNEIKFMIRIVEEKRASLGLPVMGEEAFGGLPS